MVQTKSKAKAQANAPAVQSTKLVIQNTIPKVDKIPIKTEKEKDSKPLHSVIAQQIPEGLIIPPGTRNYNAFNWYTIKCQTAPKTPKC